MGKKKRRMWPEVPEALPYPVPDNHTHLPLHPGEIPSPEGVRPSLQQQLQWAREVNIPKVITSACEVMDLNPALELAEAHPDQVRVSVAIHPNEAALHAGFTEKSPDGLEPKLEEYHSMSLDSAIGAVCDAAAHPLCVAIGETGLDYFRTAEPGREAQKQAFAAHCEIAKALDKPMQIHDRDAHADTISLLKTVGAPERTVFHCYSGDSEMAQILKENGWYASFAGPITYKANQGLRDALAVLPRELVLVETDAPYLTPEPHRGSPNGSYVMAHTVRFIAQQWEMPLEDACRQLAENTYRVYGKW
ncbi:TatD family hydrolase [Boudabousia marimammalium]|uniref:Deoxyribonuclease n=1 Tax=Boudabousia marimammalium TaxID=156892 RepID=A0A1Q5PRT3_9ACTO|nr:TatD family hydrolase [Boudabousia marimammalium]OKL50298.1 deoxyribonuclease [Boudabousia marimammalium]